MNSSFQTGLGKSITFKIVLLGKGCVGKSSIVLRYCENKFNSNHFSTVQASYINKKLTIGDNIINLAIWDTAGQERYHSLGPIYYRESSGAIVVYDVTDPESLVKAKNWIKELRNMLGNNVCLALVANKIDLLDKKAGVFDNELIQEATNYAASLDKTKHYLTSAKNNEGLQELFFDLTKRMIDYHNKSKPNTSLSQSNRTLRIKDDDTSSTDDATGRKCLC